MGKYFLLFWGFGFLFFSLKSEINQSQNADIYEQIFTQIYTSASWGRNEEGIGHSGGGSTVENTKEYRAYLQKFLKDYNIKSIVDAGCGDWEFSRFINWDGINYTGYDIVAHVIEKNNQFFASSNVAFIRANFLYTDLPKADLLLCKHVLQHLNNDAIIKFLKQLSKFKYCLITNAVDPVTLSSTNPDVSIVGGHKIDLSKPPFNIVGKKVLHYRIGNSVHQIFLVDNTN